MVAMTPAEQPVAPLQERAITQNADCQTFARRSCQCSTCWRPQQRWDDVHTREEAYGRKTVRRTAGSGRSGWMATLKVSSTPARES